MKLPIQLQFVGLEPSDALAQRAREHAEKLAQFAPDIVACHVVIAQEQKHTHQGRPYRVRVDLSLPQHQLAVHRIAHEDPYVALRDAFDSLTRQLEDVVQKRQRKVKQHPLPLQGEVVRLNTDGVFGFIGTPAGDEYYFDRDNLVGVPFENLRVGRAVQFLPETGSQGLQAKRVSIGKHALG